MWLIGDIRANDAVLADNDYDKSRVKVVGKAKPLIRSANISKNAI